MSKYLDIDSVWRDSVEYPNPANFYVGANNVNCWYQYDRTLTKGGNVKLDNSMYTINLVQLTLPYSDDLALLPRVYVNLASGDSKDKNLMFSMSNAQLNSKFVCYPCHIQKDASDNPIWIHYKSGMEQTMRMSFTADILFQVILRNGDVLVLTDDIIPDPAKQVMATFNITPYFRDGDYDNHLLGIGSG